MPGRLLPRAFYRRPAEVLAPELLNKLFVSGETAGRIVEVEAYGPEGDEASHSHRGKTRRNETMFGRPGLLYVYFTYGMHWCANAVCEEDGIGAAVLIRALEPIAGLDEMLERRRARSGRAQLRDLCSGPAKLCQSLGIDGARDGVDLASRSSPVTIRDDGVSPPRRPGVSPRIGISRSTERKWRFYVEGSRWRSR